MRRPRARATPWAIGIAAILVIATAVAIVVLTPSDEHPLDGVVAPRPPTPEPFPTDTECRLGDTDLNPDNRPVTSAPPGRRLLALHEDGRLPIGFNDHASLVGQVAPSEAAELHRGVGSTLWRVAVDWRFAEPTPGEIYLEPQDEIYCEAVRQGIRPLFVITAAPDWAADSDRACAASECHFPPDHAHLSALRELAERVAIRYPQAAAIEAWNEPNLPAFWAEPDAERYVEVLAAIYAGVKNGNPAMPVLGGSLSNTRRTAPELGRVASVEFAEQIYAAGASAVMDGLALHPYPIEPLNSARERFSESMADLRAVIERHDAGRRIWVTEVGLRTASDETEPHAATTPDAASEPIPRRAQATSLLALHRRLERAGDIDAVLFHTLVEPDERIFSAAGFGWIVPQGDGSFEPKPVYCAFAARFGERIPCDEPLVTE